jgi:hypothetical protein
VEPVPQCAILWSRIRNVTQSGSGLSLISDIKLVFLKALTETVSTVSISIFKELNQIEPEVKVTLTPTYGLIWQLFTSLKILVCFKMRCVALNERCSNTALVSHCVADISEKNPRISTSRLKMIATQLLNLNKVHKNKSRFITRNS